MNIQENDVEELCPKCGGHMVQMVEIRFRVKPEEYDLMEKLAARRCQDVGSLIMHLMWLEAGLRKLRPMVYEDEHEIKKRHSPTEGKSSDEKLT